jgi:hypothetical protein
MDKVKNLVNKANKYSDIFYNRCYKKGFMYAVEISFYDFVLEVKMIAEFHKLNRW